MNDKTLADVPEIEMPKYRSHKEVHALYIQEIGPDVAVGYTRFVPYDKRYAPLVYSNESEVVKRCRAEEMGDTGYIVVYPDGFTSWSPSKAFEDGYTLIPKNRED